MFPDTAPGGLNSSEGQQTVGVREGSYNRKPSKVIVFSSLRWMSGKDEAWPLEGVGLILVGMFPIQ